MIEAKDLIAILGILIANGIALAGVFTKLNIKITEIYRDLISVKSDLEEHKINGRIEIKEFKEDVLRDRVENKRDYARICTSLAEISASISNVRVDIAKIGTAQENSKTKKT